MNRCECGREVLPAEAQVSRRALGGVWCYRCREARAGEHQVPRGAVAEFERLGYGQRRCRLRVGQREFWGFAWSEVLALSRATQAARAAGVL